MIAGVTATQAKKESKQQTNKIKPQKENSPLFTAKKIRKFSPRARKDLVAGLIKNQNYLRAAGITSPLRIAHFFTQMAVETGGLQRIDENMNYSTKTLLRVFSRKVISIKKAKELHRKKKEIANWVYGARLENKGRDTDDGWDYRGSGFIQLTGRGNFRDRGHEVNLPFEEKPEMARRVKEGLQAATAYWKAKDINAAADKNKLKTVRKLVNGPAAHGLSRAKEWYVKAKKVFIPRKKKKRSGAAGSDIVKKRARLQNISNMLDKTGFKAKKKRGTSGKKERLSNRLKRFQQARGLPVTGKYDEDTFYALTDPIEWRYRGLQ